MSERDCHSGKGVVVKGHFGGSSSDVTARHRSSGGAVDVRRYIESRRRRERILGGNLFSDPAWDMLLELYAAQLRDEKLTVTSLCIASGVPSSTALRWISVLERTGLITQQDDPADSLRLLVGLSPEGLTRMSAFFAAEEVASSR